MTIYERIDRRLFASAELFRRGNIREAMQMDEITLRMIAAAEYDIFRPGSVMQRGVHAGMKKISRHFSDYRHFKERVKDNASGKCELCGGVGTLAHHTVDVYERPDLLTNDEMSVWLCEKCHRYVHAVPEANLFRSIFYEGFENTDVQKGLDCIR